MQRPRETISGARPARFSTLAELVGAFAVRGDRPAIHTLGDELRTLSFGALAEDIIHAARGLKARGIGRGRMVLLWAPNSPEWVAAYFAVIRAGATAIPYDPQGTPAGAAGIAAHASPALILTTADRAAQLQPLIPAGIDCLLLDADAAGEQSWRQLWRTPVTDLPTIAPDDVASLLYTSGTTGTPKAVPLTHANLAANLTALLEAQLVRADDRVLLPLPLHHTYPFTVGLLTVLATGAAVVFPASVTGPEIARAARETRATAMLAVPRLCAALWDSVATTVAARGAWARRAFAALLALSATLRRTCRVNVGRWLFAAVHERLGGSLSLIGCGGAKLERELARRLDALGFTVLTGYGLTETSPVLTFNDHRHARAGTEGRPLPGVELKIQAVPEQRHGEILARGPNVFAGYWNNPQETESAFAADGWFRTGDLGWVDHRGYLHVVGRSKELIVLPDGKKIFPESLEKAYTASPLLHEIAIFEHEGALVALIVPDERALREQGAIREASLIREQIEEVGARLPPYQRLADYRITRAALPRTQLGKLRRHLLPALYREAVRGEAPAPGEPSAEDRELLETDLGRAVWAWLHERYPDRQLAPDTSPQLDLQIDSLEWVTMTLEIERRFERQLSGEAVSRILTLRDLLREIDAAPAAGSMPTRESSFTPPGPGLRLVGALLLVTVRISMRLLFRLHVEGTDRLPRDRALVIVPNHASYLDPLAIAAALPWRQLRNTYWAGWVGVMFKGRVARFVSRATQVFPVDPDRDLAGAVRVARELLRQGRSVVWFPEGRRSPTGRVGTFQPGIGLLLDDAKADAVPTGIRGSFAAWPKQRRWPRLVPITVRFGEPLALTAGGEPETKRAALEQAVRSLVGDLDQAQPSGHTDTSS